MNEKNDQKKWSKYYLIDRVERLHKRLLRYVNALDLWIACCKFSFNKKNLFSFAKQTMIGVNFIVCYYACML